MKKVICILLLIVSMGTMYYFSSQDGEASSIQSNTVVNIVEEIRDRVTLENETLIKIKDGIKNALKGHSKNILVRKAAHFAMYAIIGGFMMIVIYMLSRQVIFSACISFTLTLLYAVYDERRQLQILGREGSLTDVFIDSSGALLSILILSCIFLFGKGVKCIFKRFREADDSLEKFEN